MPELGNGNSWMVMTGQPVDGIGGGGFEFFGPFDTNEEAVRFRKAARISYEHEAVYKDDPGDYTWIIMAIQLLKPGNKYGYEPSVPS